MIFLNKVLKYSLVVLIASIIVSTMYTVAVTGYIAVAGVNLPAFQGEVYVVSENKGQYNPQHYKNNGVSSNLTPTSESVYVKTVAETGPCVGSGNNYILIGNGQTAGWNTSYNCNGLVGRYGLYAKRQQWTITTASHSGIWYLDEGMM